MQSHLLVSEAYCSYRCAEKYAVIELGSVVLIQAIQSWPQLSRDRSRLCLGISISSWFCRTFNNRLFFTLANWFECCEVLQGSVSISDLCCHPALCFPPWSYRIIPAANCCAMCRQKETSSLCFFLITFPILGGNVKERAMRNVVLARAVQVAGFVRMGLELHQC